MTALSRRWTIAVIALAAIFVLPLPALASAGSTAAVAAPPTVPGAVAPAAALEVHNAGTALVDRTRAAMASDHIPQKDVYLPNFNAQISTASGHVTPLYATSPAPMGLGYWGVVRHGSRDVGTISYTNSVEAKVTVNSIDPFYLASTSPDYVGFQLNTVATHVTVLGNSSDEFWTQNVLYYSKLQGTLQFLENIWNFSSPTAAMQTGTLYNYSGILVPNDFYYGFSPVYSVPTPFSVRLYNNLTIWDLRPTIFFNYSVTTSNGSSFSGSYGFAQFNSFTSPVVTKPAAPATFQINGLTRNPIGLLNDAEIMIGGPGGGSTTTLQSINATFGLYLKANRTGTYASVPSGYDFGTDTGETSEGVAEYTNGGPNPVAVLNGGPSLLYPLWGLTGTMSGSVTEHVALTPSNAFAFASMGRHVTTDTAAWAPMPASGVASFRLAAGHIYSFEFLLSDYKPRTVTLTGSTRTTIALTADAALGVYTPLWAWNDRQLAAISSSGNGTLSNPYVLDNVAYGPLSPLFGEFNDYFYQVFPGLFLGNTNAYVVATGLPDFVVDYTITPEALYAAHFGTPSSNDLALEFYNSSHASLVDNAQITGWFGAINGFGPSYGSLVLVWNSSHDLFAGNDFEVQSGVGIQLAGGSDNVLWGNSFSTATTSAANPADIINDHYQTGALLYESGDLVYNNYFDTVYTAYTPTFNLYTGAFAVWADTWNVTPMKANATRVVNGIPLTGSIVGLSTVSGNWWDDYGTAGNPYGVIPYDEYGAITVGGDYHPLLTYAIYKVTFDAVNLTAGVTNWTVTINGYTQLTSGLSLVFWEPAGTWAYTVGTAAGFTATPSYGAVQLTTHGVTAKIRFS